MLKLILSAAIAIPLMATAASAQPWRGHNNEVRREIRECQRELRRADNRWEYQRERRECQREIAQARREARRDWRNDRYYRDHRRYDDRYGYYGRRW